MKCVPHAARPVTTFAVLASLRRPEGVCAAALGAPRARSRVLPARQPGSNASMARASGPLSGPAVS